MRHETWVLSVCAYKCVRMCRSSAGICAVIATIVCMLHRLSWFYSSFLIRNTVCAHTHDTHTLTHICRLNFHTYISYYTYLLPFSMCVLQKKWSEIDLTWLDLTEWIAWKRARIASIRAYVFVCTCVLLLLLLLLCEAKEEKTHSKQCSTDRLISIDM